MKKFTTIFVLFFAFALLTSCGSSKPKIITEKTSSFIANKEVLTSEKTIEKSNPINDTINYFVGQIKTGEKRCDSLTTAELDRLFNSMQFSKTSGDNSWSIKYDALLKKFQIVSKLGETSKTTAKTEASKSEIVYLDRQKKVEIPVQFIPWYVKYLWWWFGVTASIILIYTTIKVKQFIPK